MSEYDPKVAVNPEDLARVAEELRAKTSALDAVPPGCGPCPMTSSWFSTDYCYVVPPMNHVRVRISVHGSSGLVYTSVERLSEHHAGEHIERKLGDGTVVKEVLPEKREQWIAFLETVENHGAHDGTALDQGGEVIRKAFARAKELWQAEFDKGERRRVPHHVPNGD